MHRVASGFQTEPGRLNSFPQGCKAALCIRFCKDNSCFSPSELVAMASFRLPFRVPAIEELAIPAVSILILFLAYTSQYLFYYIEPGPFSRNQALWFNGLVLAIWWCYDRACTVDPGPKGWIEKLVMDGNEREDVSDELKLKNGMRWCRKCDAAKPPRAHHCKQCGRYAQIHAGVLLSKVRWFC